MEPENNHLNKRLRLKRFEDISGNRVNSVNAGEEAGPSVDQKPQYQRPPQMPLPPIPLPPIPPPPVPRTPIPPPPMPPLSRMMMSQTTVQLAPYQVPIPQARQSDWGNPVNSNVPVSPSLYTKRARESPTGQMRARAVNTVQHHGVYPSGFSTNHPDYEQHHDSQGQAPMTPLNLSLSRPQSVGSNTVMFPTNSSGIFREEVILEGNIFQNHRVISSGFRTLRPEQIDHGGHQDLIPLSRQNLVVSRPPSVENNTVMLPINPTGNFLRGDINDDFLRCQRYAQDCCCKRMRREYNTEIEILKQTVYRLQEQLKSVVGERDFLLRRCELLQGGSVSGGFATRGQSNPTNSTEHGNWRQQRTTWSVPSTSNVAVADRYEGAHM